MTSPEFNANEHEAFVSERLKNLRRTVARVALFDEMIDYHLNGDCTFEQAMAQFHHDADRLGIGYAPTTTPESSTL